MHKYLCALCIFITISIQVSADTPKKELLRFFIQWKSGKTNTTSIIKYKRVNEILTPKTVQFDKIDDTFYDGIYENIINDSDLAALVDIDSDGIDEAFVLLIQGSGRFPIFYAFKKDIKKGIYKRIVFEERHIETVDFDGKIYFIESIRDFNSGRWQQSIIYEMMPNMKLIPLATIITSYSYTFSTDVRNYINSSELNKIAQQDYSFLGIQDKNPAEFSVNVENVKIQANIRWTSVGYFATTVTIKITDKLGHEKVFKDIWGFKCGTYKGIPFICIVLMDDNKRVSAIKNFRINVYNLENWHEIASEYIEASENLVIE